jgi:hypothetical protein
MLAAILLTTLNQAISNPDSALERAKHLLTTLNYKIPDDKPNVKNSFVGEREPAWSVEYKTFLILIKENGVISHFKRNSGNYKLLKPARPFATSEEARKELAKLTHLIGLSPEVYPEFTGWKPGKTYDPKTATQVTIMPIYNAPNGKKYSFGMMQASAQDRSVELYFPGVCTEFPHTIRPFTLHHKNSNSQFLRHLR